jgi:hypothetical protein
MPEAPINGRHIDAQVSGDPSAYSVKRMGDDPSVLPPTGPAGSSLGLDHAPPKKGDSASARHIDASVLENERNNLYSMLSRTKSPAWVTPLRTCASEMACENPAEAPCSGTYADDIAG